MTRRRCALLLGALSTAICHPRARADSTAKFKLDTATVQVATTDSTIKTTALYDTDGDNFNGWLAGFTLKMAASSVEGHAETRLDDFTTDWRLGLSFGRELALGRDKLRFQLEPEWGVKNFKYYPGAATASQTSFEHSLDLGANALYYHEPEEAAPMAFQIKVRFGNDWEDSKATGIVTPAMDPLPALVKSSKIIDTPVEQASLTMRLFYWRQVTAGSEWAIGPSLAASIAGPKVRTFTLGGTDVARAEFWLYFVPSTAAPANFRIGVAPFISLYLKGEAPDGRTTVPGAFFQARYGAPIFSY